MQRRSFLTSTAALAVAAGSPACGYILYPERRGRVSGRIDIGVLIIDLLWLLPGLVPGAICLAVDFTTGCIYATGGSAERDASDGDVLVAEVDVDEEVVARADVTNREGKLAWNQSVAREAIESNGRLVIRRADGATATAMVRTLIDPPA